MSKMSIRKIPLVAGLAVVLLNTGEASAQVLDGEWWQAKLAGQTRVIEVAPIPDPGEGDSLGDPALRTLVNGKIKKAEVYLYTIWLPDEDAYRVDTWHNQDGTWTETTDACRLRPFGEGFPESKDAFFEGLITLDSGDPLPQDGQFIDLRMLVKLKAKVDSKSIKTPGADEVQFIDIAGATTGTYTLVFEGQETAALEAASTPEAIEAALEALSTIGAGNVMVGPPVGSGPQHAVTFQGDLGQKNVDPITVGDDATVGGTGVVTSTGTEGTPDIPAVKNASFKGQSVGAAMDAVDFDGEGNDMIGKPTWKAKRVTKDKVPFPVPDPADS